jgi:hypothetical protein
VNGVAPSTLVLSAAHSGFPLRRGDAEHQDVCPMRIAVLPAELSSY